MRLLNHRNTLTTCLILYFVAQVVFLLFIQFPKGHCFDEFHYVPSAKQFLALSENQNWEHPPLGKELMAIGIGLFGDRPIGWRFMSTVFGALTLVGMYLWGLAMFRNQRHALFVAGLTFFNQLLYVQSRIGMLDTFMFAFIAWGLAAFTASWDSTGENSPKENRRLLMFCGAMMGFATACKWTAVISWAYCLGLILFIRTLQKWGTQFTAKSDWDRWPGFRDWYSRELWAGVTGKQIALALVAVPVTCYFVTFLPFLFVNRTPSYGLWDLILMQPKMFDGQLRVVNEHPYMSKWTQWPLMLRPIWYAFDKEGSEYVRGVILVGNPMIMWPGLAAVAICLWGWLARRSREAFLISITWLAFTLCWAVIPRKIAFYYYYYPAGMTLSLALTYVFVQWETWMRVHSSTPDKHAKYVWAGACVFLAAAALFFQWFFPVLAGLRIPSDSFHQWMLMRTWI